MFVVLALAVGALATLPSRALPAHDLVRNPGFEGAFSGPISFTGPGGGPAAPSQWSAFNNGGGTTTTEVVPSTAPDGDNYMVHVVTENDSSGLVQTGISVASGAGVPWGVMHAKVFVLSGSVKICFGPIGSPPCLDSSRGTGHWEEFSGLIRPPDNPNEINQEIVIYSAGGAAAEFYVDNVSVIATGPRV